MNTVHDSSASSITAARLHDIYRMRDLSGRLLYIGVTNGGLRRFMEHSKDKTWWREVAQIDVEHIHCSRMVIEAVEREAIGTERPLYNVTHNRVAELPPPTRALAAHQCGDHCLVSHRTWGRLMLGASLMPQDAKMWVRMVLQSRPKDDDGMLIANVQSARQLAVLVTLVRRQTSDEHCSRSPETMDRALLNIMQGGWGVPFDEFHNVSAADCIAILHRYFDEQRYADLMVDGEICMHHTSTVSA